MNKRIRRILAAGTCMGVVLTLVGNQVVFAKETDNLVMESQTYAVGTTTISTAEDFLMCAQSGELDGNYVLLNDIDISSYVGEIAGKNLNGTFDGNGHTIYGLQGEKTMFGFVRGAAVIKNLTVDGTLNVNSSSFQDVGGICKHNSGRIENCVSSVDISISGTSVRVGGIVAQNGGIITGCKNEGNLSGSMREVGGITAISGGTLVSDCENIGNLTVYCEENVSCFAGGIIGCESDFGVNSSEYQIMNCKNSGTIQITANHGVIGGILGDAWTKGNNTDSKITNCTNVGTISGTGRIGGVVGTISVSGGGAFGGELIPYNGNIIIENCWNTGTIIVQASGEIDGSDVGGIFGWAEMGSENSGTIYVKDSNNVGSLYVGSSKGAGYNDLGGIGGFLWNAASEAGINNAYIFVENCKNKGYVDENARTSSGQVARIQGTNMAVTGCDYNGETYKTDMDGTIHGYYADGNSIVNQFVFDGRYTYYFQADGTAMRDRLTYHPDGEHIIYLDSKGHEVFTDFQYCPSVGYTCYFDSQGYLYKDQITFVGDKVYYLNGNGAMEQNGWFRFANGVDYGFANWDGTLKSNGFSYDPWGRIVFYHWNGMVARGLITDGVWYYSMDTTDGHYLGSFPVN